MENKEKTVSVVMPTYNGETRLPDALSYFAGQSYPLDKFEVIVVNDGSTDGTENYLKKCNFQFNFKFVSHSLNRGRAATCNTGIRQATGEIIIILDDDMSLQPDFVFNHVRYHLQEKPVGVLGMIKRAAQNKITPFIRWQNSCERRSVARNAAEKDNVASFGISTGNFSLKKEVFLKVGLYDEDFINYGLEDWELGYRLKNAKVRFVYAEDVASIHNFYVNDFAKLCKRKEQEGRSAVIFLKKHPELSAFLEIDTVWLWQGATRERIKKNIKLILINPFTLPLLLLAIFFSERIFNRGFDFFYNQIGAYYYRRGIKKSWRALSRNKPLPEVNLYN